MKNKLQFRMGAPVTLFIFMASAVALILDSFVLGGKATQTILSCPAARGKQIFLFTVPINYVRLLLHPLGQSGFQIFFMECALFLSLGLHAEENYGSPVLVLMVFFSSLVAGVLNAAAGNCSIQGLSPLIFLLLILSLNGTQAKGTIYFPSLVLLLLYISFRAYISFTSDGSYTDPEAGTVSNILYKCIAVLIPLAGGCAGSLFGFLSSRGKSSQNKKWRKNNDTTEAML